ncbi:MAG: hypothetical protein IRY85_11070, partial [Micromonosporaceae bacterium]|nr:hypothetical protein [Micromonosporaceae bacterium]
MTSQSTQSQDNPLAGFGPNEWIVEDMYQRYLADPSSVDAAWHDFFTDYRPSWTTATGELKTVRPRPDGATATATVTAPAPDAAPATTTAA